MGKSDLHNEVREAFKELYPTQEERYKSKTQFITDFFEDIEKAQKHGVKLIQLVSVIRDKSGLDISYEDLRTIIYKIRKKEG
ncbi:hypothetical protein JCM19233_4512 [Vibrio astriarenae]|nr:hypothetical protein JCM19233_4512 [Vibrio sp. C7]